MLRVKLADKDFKIKDTAYVRTHKEALDWVERHPFARGATEGFNVRIEDKRTKVGCWMIVKEKPTIH